MNSWFELEVQKYWAPTSAMSRETRLEHLQQMAHSGQYLWSEKIDGNFTRGIITKDRTALQTRGISKVTGTYSELQEKVFFWNDVVKAFQYGDTVILGELYLPNGIDKDVGSLARCLIPKARARQEQSSNYLHWYIFDILALDGESFLNKPIEERIKYIPEVVKRINNSLVRGAEYKEMNENFFDEINQIFQRGGEGAVAYKKGILYTPGKRSSAWTTMKVKQEIENEIDAIITGIEPAVRGYTGGDLPHWQLWLNTRTMELVKGPYYGEYALGGPYEPVSKGFFYHMPGAIYTSVYDKNGNLIPLCKVAGLTDEFKTQLRDNFEEWRGCPITLGGMMISTAQATTDGIGISIRHPYIKRIRRDDLNPTDCTLEKILGNE